MAEQKQEIKLTKQERKMLEEALDFKLTQHERASKSYSDTPLGAAHAEMGSICASALMKIRNHQLEL